MADCGLSDAVLDLLESCWDDDPNERPRDALALAEALASARVEPASPPRPKDPLSQPAPAGSTADPVTDYARWKRQIDDRKAQAQGSADVFDYARAVAILETVPSKHRDDALLEDWTQKRDRLAEVWGRVQASWRDMTEDELNDDLEEVLSLHPNHPQAKPWLAQVSSPERQQRRRLHRGKVGDVIEVLLTNALKLKLAWVPPGQSWLGGGGGTPGTEEFTLPKGLWCGIYPVTQAEWQAVMGNNPSHFGGRPRNPVEQVSWDDVQVFLEKLNGRLAGGGLTYRLPTEQEWEYICRGGPLSREQSAYHFSFARSKTDLTPVPTNDLSSRQANFDGNYPAGSASKGPYLQATSEVGLYLPNPLGIYDLHGNVWEWTSSVYEGSSRVIRGGCWFFLAEVCTASNRNRLEPVIRLNSLGFRVLAAPSERR